MDKDAEIKKLKEQLKSLAEISKSFIEAASICLNSRDNADIKAMLSEQLAALEYAIEIAEGKRE